MTRVRTFALYAKRHRLLHGLTQADLAAAMQVSKAFVVDMERSRTIPSYDAVLGLASAFEVDSDEIWLEIARDALAVKKAPPHIIRSLTLDAGT